MHCTCTRLTSLVAAGAALLALPAATLAQDPGSPPPADAVPVKVTVSAPASVTHDALKKGVPIKVTCAPACSAQLTLTGKIGIINQTSLDVPEGATRTKKVKGTAAQIRELKKGSKVTISVMGRGGDGGRGMAQKTIKVK